MTIRNLLLAYDGSDGAHAALSLGLKMARKYGAHLTGLMPHSGPPQHLWLKLGNNRGELERFLDREQSIAETAEKRFRAATEGVENVHWRRQDGSGDLTVAEQARCYDLTLMGQYDASREDTGYALHPDRVALISGRPLIVVPRGHDRMLGDRAVLAWDGQRAAARALADSMAILETKAEVTILNVASSGEAREDEALLRHLERHGIASNWVSLERERGGVGPTLLKWCAENDPSLLVMGAYEHSKFREDLFGGVTNSLLRHLPAPLFMAH